MASVSIEGVMTSKSYGGLVSTRLLEAAKILWQLKNVDAYYKSQPKKPFKSIKTIIFLRRKTQLQSRGDERAPPQVSGQIDDCKKT